MRTARITLFFFYVACPYCHEPQPELVDGLYLTFKELPRPKPKPCVHCTKVYQLPRQWPENFWQQEEQPE